MNILVVEYFTGGGLCGRNASDELPRELCKQGESMLLALVDDLVRIEGVRVIITRDARLPPLAISGIDTHVVRVADDWMGQLHELLCSADAFWPIAPETERTLESLCALCDHGDRLLLNSSAVAVRCAASKYMTAKSLEQAGLPYIKTWRSEHDWREEMDLSNELVVKPDDGFACEGLRIVSGTFEVGAGMVVQPFIKGRAFSLSVLYGGGEHRLVGLNLHELERCGDGLSLSACVVNGICQRWREFDDLAKRIGERITGLAGYVGVDCIEQGDEVYVVEINPRITSSYVGLYRSLSINIAACVISLLTRESTPFFNIESAVAVRVTL